MGQKRKRPRFVDCVVIGRHAPRLTPCKPLDRQLAAWSANKGWNTIAGCLQRFRPKRKRGETMKNVLKTIIFATALMLVGQAFAQGLPTAQPETVDVSPERLSRIRAVLQKEVEADRMPGAVVMIARRGQLIYSDAIGFQDKAAGKPMTKDAIFRIYSMTKPLTSVAAMMLVGE